MIWDHSTACHIISMHLRSPHLLPQLLHLLLLLLLHPLSVYPGSLVLAHTDQVPALPLPAEVYHRLLVTTRHHSCTPLSSSPVL